jgi:hypothetical protein
VRIRNISPGLMTFFPVTLPSGPTLLRTTSEYMLVPAGYTISGLRKSLVHKAHRSRRDIKLLVRQ